MSLTRANPLSSKLPNHISEAFLVARSKYKNILWNVSLGGEGGEIPKGGRAGRARSLGIWPPGGARSLGIWPRGGARSLGIWPPGGRDHGGGAKSLGHRVKTNPGCVYTTLFQTNPGRTRVSLYRVNRAFDYRKAYIEYSIISSYSGKWECVYWI